MKRFLKAFKGAYQNEYRGDHIFPAVVWTFIGTVAGFIGVGLNTAFIAPEDGIKGEDISALQVQKYGQEIATLGTLAATVNEAASAQKVFANEKLFDTKDPVIAAQVSSFQQKFKALQQDYKSNYEGLAYRMTSDKTLGEDDTEKLFQQFNTTVGQPEWMKMISTNGLQECRLRYEKALAAEAPILISSCTDDVTDGQVANVLLSGAGLGFFGLYLGIPFMGAVSAVRRQRREEKESGEIRQQIVMKKGDAP